MTGILEDYFARLCERVPEDPVKEICFQFSRDTVPPAPEHISTVKLAASIGVHSYTDSYWIDHVVIETIPATVRSLGCLIFSLLFSPTLRELEVSLHHPRTVLRRLILDFGDPALADEYPGLALQPLKYGYYPGEPERYPLRGRGGDCGGDAPWFDVTNEARRVGTEAERSSRDTLVLAGTPVGLASFAELCLDAGRENRKESEFVLECPSAGLGGVACTSAEVRLLLPGALGWALDEPAEAEL